MQRAVENRQIRGYSRGTECCARAGILVWKHPGEADGKYLGGWPAGGRGGKGGWRETTFSWILQPYPKQTAFLLWLSVVLTGLVNPLPPPAQPGLEGELFREQDKGASPYTWKPLRGTKWKNRTSTKTKFTNSTMHGTEGWLFSFRK